MPSTDFIFTQENLLKLEAILASQSPKSDEVWRLRIPLFSLLADLAYAPKQKRFNLGMLSYLAWLLVKCVTAKPAKKLEPPAKADFLVYIGGNVSKEVDTLSPVVTALQRAGHSVLVLWGSAEPVPKKIEAELNGAKIWTIPGLADLAAFRPFIPVETVSALRLLAKTFFCLLPMKGVWKAFWRSSSWWMDYLLRLKLWERLLASLLAAHDFKGVAVVSETAVAAHALCRVASQRGWPIHHFLHGFASFANTRTMADHIYVFCGPERDFFIQNGCSGEQVHAIGHPRQISLAAEVQTYQTLPPGQGNLRVLFASQPAWEGGIDEEECRDTLRAVFETARRLRLTPAEIRVRLHPAENCSAYLELSRHYMPGHSNEMLSNRRLAEDLGWANVLVTVMSTMAIEASYAGCFLVWLMVGDFRYEIREKLIKAGYGHKAESADDLQREFISCKEAQIRENLIAEMMRKAQSLGILNPRSADFIVAAMEKAAA